jgi:hypothetical protein
MANTNDESEYMQEARAELQKEYALLSPEAVFSEWRRQLVQEVNRLIRADFSRLINSLYRLDVSETKLKYLLQQNSGENAPAIIADLIIERQVQKIKSRREFSRRDDNISEEDKW